MKKYALITIIVILSISGAILLLRNISPKNQVLTSNNYGIIIDVPIMGKNHIHNGTKATYNSNPPTSGNHWSEHAEWGFYKNSLPDEMLVHNLEHGGIWISYKDIDGKTLEKLSQISQLYPRAVIITERPQNDAKIAIASWGKLLKLETIDEELITSFIKTNVNKSPEPLAIIG